MLVNTVTETKAHLSALLDRVARGEEVIIARAGKPVAILEPYHAERQQRCPGLLRGKIRLADDFDDLPPDVAAVLGMVVDA